MIFCKALIALAVASGTFGVLVATASARQLSLSSTSIRTTFPRVEFVGGLGRTVCNVTLDERFHSRTLTKNLEGLIGYVTQASVSGCEVGSATILTASLPWHIRYSGFTGNLPNVFSVGAKIIGASYRISESLFGIECLAVSTATSPMTRGFTRELGGRFTQNQVGGAIPCNPGGITSTLRGTSNSMTAVTVTLI